MNVPFTVHTERTDLVLRQLTLDDAEAYFTAVDGSREHLSKFDDVTADNYPDLLSVEDSIINPRNAGKLRMGIWAAEIFVGSINATPDEDGIEIGYWLDKNHTGNGYATIATRAFARFMSKLNPNVYAKVVVGNEASTNVLIRSGFVPTGHEDDRSILTFADSRY